MDLHTPLDLLDKKSDIHTRKNGWYILVCHEHLTTWEGRDSHTHVDFRSGCVSSGYVGLGV